MSTPTISPELLLPASTEDTAATSPAEATSQGVSNKREQIALRLEDEMLAAIDFEVGEAGFMSRAELVQRAMVQYLSRQQQKRLSPEVQRGVYPSASGRLIHIVEKKAAETLGREHGSSPAPSPRPKTFEEKVWPERESRKLHAAEKAMTGGVVYTVFLGETNSRNKPTKMLTLRKFYKRYPMFEETAAEKADSQETWSMGEAFTVQRSVIPWLIAHLQAAEDAMQQEATENRRTAHLHRAGRDPVEVDKDETLKAEYTARYSKEQLSKAVKLATAHKARAIRHQQSEHFTWWEWLDACARSQFRCPTCDEASPLSPHHRVALSRGGTNTIDNIEPVCQKCHGCIEGLEDYTQQWLVREQELFEKFRAGDLVRSASHSYQNRDWTTRISAEEVPGIIVQMRPPESPIGPLWASCHCTGYTHYHNSRHYQNRVEAQAIVRWPDGREESVRPDKLVKFDADAWNAEQQQWIADQMEMMNAFAEGETVWRQYGHNLSKKTSWVIVRLIPPVSGPLWGLGEDGRAGFLPSPLNARSKAKARLRGAKDGKTKYSVVELDNLVKVTREADG